MYSVMVICLFGFVTVDSTYSSDGLLFNAEDSPLWKSSNGVVFLRPPSRRSIEASTNHNKDAQDMKWLGLGKRAEAKLTPYISVGVLSDMKGFFDNLQTNIDTLEEPHDRQKENANFLDKDFTLQIPRGYGFRPHKASDKIRNFVDYSDGQNLRRSNMYDPNLLWSGLGKKR